MFTHETITSKRLPFIIDTSRNVKCNPYVFMNETVKSEYSKFSSFDLTHYTKSVNITKIDNTYLRVTKP